MKTHNHMKIKGFSEDKEEFNTTVSIYNETVHSYNKLLCKVAKGQYL